jgi:hypothetical protein
MESQREFPAETGELALPPGTAPWITPELVRKTLLVWQPYYQAPLSVEDAVTMIQSVGRLFGVLRRS